MNPFVAMNTWNTPFNFGFNPLFNGPIQTPYTNTFPASWTPSMLNGWNSGSFTSPISGWNLPFNGLNTFGQFSGLPFSGLNTFGQTTGLPFGGWNTLNQLNTLPNFGGFPMNTASTPNFIGSTPWNWTPSFNGVLPQGFSPISSWSTPWNTPFVNTFGVTSPYAWTTPNTFGWTNPSFGVNGQNGYATVNPINGFSSNPFINNGQNVGINNPMHREAA